jgi:hypothetical protein
VTVAGQREVIREYSDKLLIFLLKSRRPQRFARFDVPAVNRDPVGVTVRSQPRSPESIARSIPIAIETGALALMPNVAAALAESFGSKASPPNPD